MQPTSLIFIACKKHVIRCVIFNRFAGKWNATWKEVTLFQEALTHALNFLHKWNASLIFKFGKVFYMFGKMKFSVKDFLVNVNKFPRKLQIRSHLLKKYFMENFILDQCVSHFRSRNFMTTFLQIARKKYSSFWVF